MMNILQFKLSMPTPYMFMRRFLKAAHSDKKVSNVPLICKDYYNTKVTNKYRIRETVPAGALVLLLGRALLGRMQNAEVFTIFAGCCCHLHSSM